MAGYLGHFIVYTIAMIGIIFAALLVYKKVAEGCGFASKSDFLNIEDRISLSPRKNLYVIRAGKERFLIASDMDRTNLIAKLDDNEKLCENVSINQETKSSIDELPSIVNFQKNKKQPVMKKMINGIKSVNEIDIVE